MLYLLFYIVYGVFFEWVAASNGGFDILFRSESRNCISSEIYEFGYGQFSAACSGDHGVIFDE